MQAERIKRAYGTGSITERDGKFYGAVALQRARGRRDYLARSEAKAATVLTAKQAEAKLRELMASVAVEAARPISNGRTIQDLGDAYIEHARTHKGLKEATTLKDYASTVRLQSCAVLRCQAS